MAQQDNFDALIIGGGPAGISCAAELKDSGLTSLILEKSSQLGGQLSDIPTPLRNFVGGNYDNGEALRVKLVEFVERMQLKILFNHSVSEVDLSSKCVVSQEKKFYGKTIVIATGYRVAKLGLVGENTFGLDVLYRTGHCLDHLKGKPVAVVGGGDSAVENALELVEFCPEVYLIHRRGELRARKDWADNAKGNPRIKFLLNTQVVSLLSDNGHSQSETKNLSGIEVLSIETGIMTKLAVNRLVIKAGYAPNTEPFVRQVSMDDLGHVFIDHFCQSSEPGVFAIGDITNPGYPRIATSIGHGVLTVAGIRRYLKTMAHYLPAD